MAAPMTAVRTRTASRRSRTRVLAPRQLIPRLSVVVVNYQRWADTVSLVRDLRQSAVLQEGGAEIIVVDNNSPDDRLVNVLRRWQGVTLKRSRTNRGFSRAVNAAAGISSGDWYLFLNPDMSVEAGFLDRALALAEQAAREDPALGIVGFQVRNSDGSLQGSTGPYPTFAGTLARLLLPRCRRKYSVAPQQRGTVPWVTGCCLMVRRECFRALGGFDKNFFLYYEDVDLCQRARTHGWTVWHEPVLPIMHHRPLHTRQVNSALRLLTRHALLTYASRHWRGWQVRLLAHLIRLESRVRAGWETWRGNDKHSFDHISRIAMAIAQDRPNDARRILQRVIRRQETAGV